LNEKSEEIDETEYFYENSKSIATPGSQVGLNHNNHPESVERYYSGRKKHFRRCANEIEKSFICPY
jgi:hypothetical protein